MPDSAVRLLTLQRLDGDRFVGASAGRPDWVYGGQAVGQGLRAASATVADDRHVNSVHAQYLRAGDPMRPIEYTVERIRDGRSFSTRSVRAAQGDQAIAMMTATFHAGGHAFEHQVDVPVAPPPETAPPSSELPPVDPGWPRWLVGRTDLDLRRVEIRQPAQPGEAMIWSRVAEPVPDDPALHACLRAYLSDLTLLMSVRHHHEPDPSRRNWSTRTLDHSVWFHRPVRADEWLLLHQHSPIAANGRGFTRATVYTADGTLVGSLAQEGVIKPYRR